MIIKIDVKDNDFAEKVADRLNSKVNGLVAIYDDYYYSALKKEVDNEDPNPYVTIAKERDDIKDWIYNEKIPTDKIKEAKEIIKKSVLFLIKNSFDDDDLEYLEDEIEISFPKTMKAEWENGEVIYYFPHTYSKNKFMLF
jgi:hypothetical protein